jgi:predicted DsbA family dithiol-disulfide isomerase
VRLAQHMAVASEKVRAIAIEATEFPAMARAYRVMGVPKVVINDRVEFEGALPEAEFLQAVLRAVGDGNGDSHPTE